MIARILFLISRPTYPCRIHSSFGHVQVKLGVSPDDIPLTLQTRTIVVPSGRLAGESTLLLALLPSMMTVGDPRIRMILLLLARNLYLTIYVKITAVCIYLSI